MTADKTAVPEWIDVAFADGFGWSTYAAHEGDKTRFIRSDLCASGQVQAVMDAADRDADRCAERITELEAALEKARAEAKRMDLARDQFLGERNMLAEALREIQRGDMTGMMELTEAEAARTRATWAIKRIGTPVAALTPAPEVIAKGLSDDTTGLGRFGHHPDPAIDFCIEVEMLDSRLHQAEHGLCKPGDTPETVAEVLADIKRAMEFTVGGDEGAVRAKSILRSLEKRATPTAQEAVPTEDELDEAWKSGFNAGFGEAKLTTNPPQPSETVAESELIDAAIFDADQVSDLIANGKRVPLSMTEDLRNHVRKLVAALRALKGENHG